MRANTEGGEGGNNTTTPGGEIKVPGGEGGSNVDIPPAKPEASKTVSKSEWFVTTNEGDLFAHLISMDSTPKDYAAKNLEDGTYWFTNKITYTNGDTTIKTVKVVVGNGTTPTRPGAGIPEGDSSQTNPGTNPGSSVEIEEGGTNTIKPGIGKPGDEFEWWVKPSGGDDGAWTRLPSDKYPGMTPDPDTGELILGPEVDPGDYDFEVIVKEKPSGNTTKQEIDDINIKNDNPFIADDNEINDGTRPVRPTTPSATPEGEKWSIRADGEDSWTDIEAPSGGVGAIESANLDLAPGYYTIRVVTTDAKGKVHEEYFPIHIPHTDKNTPASHTPTNLVDVNVQVSVSVSATVNTNVNASDAKSTLSSTPHGAVSPSGTFKTHLGDTESFYVYPDEGYTVDKAFVKKTDGSFRGVALKGFDPANTKAKTNEFNLLSLFGLDQAFADDATLTPTYYECYTFDLLMEDAIVKDNNIDIFVAFKKIEDENYTLIPVGETYDVTFEAHSGVIYPKEDMRIPAGCDVSFVAYPAKKGANLTTLTVGEKLSTPTLKDNGVYTHTFKATSEVATVKPLGRASKSTATIPVLASFESLSYFTVTGKVVPVGAGTIEPQSANVEAGGSQVFTMRANPGYTLSHVTRDGVSFTPQKTEEGWSYTLSDIQAPTTLTAVFVVDQAALTNLHEVRTTVEGGHGAVSPEVAYVEDGKDQSFTLIPDAGYEVGSISVDGAEGKQYAGASTFVLQNVTEDHTIAVTFQPAQTGGSAIDRTVRTLKSLAQTGDLNGPLALGLLTLACATLGVAILASDRRRKSERGSHVK